VKRLVDDGHEVTVIDSLIRGSEKNLEGYFDRVNFITADLRRPLLKQFETSDVVFDLAARVSGIWGLYQDQAGFVRDNIMILFNVLEHVGNVKHYFWMSSSCVYNFDGCPLPHREEHAFAVPKTGYDVSKRFGEEIVRLYAEEHGFKYTIVRPFNIYGLGESEEFPHVITDFWNRILEEKRNPTGKFWILGSGEQTRSFTYIKDFVDATILLMERGETGTFNVGTGEETRIIDLLKVMFEIARLPFDQYEIEHREPFKQDVLRRCPDVSKILRLGWKPKYTLKDGLREMWMELNK
jgi:UDP-glucose 4-epimerase